MTIYGENEDGRDSFCEFHRCLALQYTLFCTIGEAISSLLLHSMALFAKHSFVSLMLPALAISKEQINALGQATAIVFNFFCSNVNFNYPACIYEF